MKWLKRAGIAVGTLVIISFIALASLQHIIKPATIKNFLNKELSAALHHKTHINGDVHWKLLPSASLSVNDISIGNLNTRTNHAHIKNLTLTLQLKPLLHKQLVFNKITIDELKAALNLSEMASQGADTSMQKIKESKAVKNNNKAAIQLNIDTFEVRNSQITILQEKNSVDLQSLYINSKQFNLTNQPFSLTFHSDFAASNDGIKSKGQLQFNGDATLLKESQRNTNDTLAIPLKLEGVLKLQNLILNKLHIHAIKGNLRIADDSIDINPLTVRLYQGHSSGKLSLSSAKVLSIAQKGSGINSNALFTDLSGKQYIDGNLDFTVNAKLPLSQANLVDALLGAGQLSITKGTLFNINLKAIISKLDQQINEIWKDRMISWKDAFSVISIDPSIATNGNTPFERAEVSFSLKKGVFHAHNVLIETPELNTKGNFSLNLNSQKLDGQLQTQVMELPKNSHLAKIQSFLGGYFPFTISGKRNKPIVLPDRKLIAPIIRTYILRDTVKNHLEKPVKDLKNEFKKWLH